MRSLLSDGLDGALQTQEEFKGWIALSERLETEVAAYKRSDMENRMIIKRMHEELEMQVPRCQPCAGLSACQTYSALSRSVRRRTTSTGSRCAGLPPPTHTEESRARAAHRGTNQLGLLAHHSAPFRVCADSPNGRSHPQVARIRQLEDELARRG